MNCPTQTGEVTELLEYSIRTLDARRARDLEVHLESCAGCREFLTAQQAVWAALKETGNSWLDDKVPRLSASLAYYTVLAAAPLVVLAVSIASLVFQAGDVREHITGQFHRRFILPDTADGENVNASGRNGVLAIVIPKQPKAQPRRITVK